MVAQGTFVPDEEELSARPKGALQDSKVSLVTPGKFFGIKGLGFTKENELFAGRLAQLGFAASLIGEGLTGKGILGQLNVEVSAAVIFYLPFNRSYTARSSVKVWWTPCAALPCLLMLKWALYDLFGVCTLLHVSCLTLP